MAVAHSRLTQLESFRVFGVRLNGHTNLASPLDFVWSPSLAPVLPACPMRFLFFCQWFILFSWIGETKKGCSHTCNRVSVYLYKNMFTQFYIHTHIYVYIWLYIKGTYIYVHNGKFPCTSSNWQKDPFSDPSEIDMMQDGTTSIQDRLVSSFRSIGCAAWEA